MCSVKRASCILTACHGLLEKVCTDGSHRIFCQPLVKFDIPAVISKVAVATPDHVELRWSKNRTDHQHVAAISADNLAAVTTENGTDHQHESPIAFSPSPSPSMSPSMSPTIYTTAPSANASPDEGNDVFMYWLLPIFGGAAGIVSCLGYFYPESGVRCRDAVTDCCRDHLPQWGRWCLSMCARRCIDPCCRNHVERDGADTTNFRVDVSADDDGVELVNL